MLQCLKSVGEVNKYPINNRTLNSGCVGGNTLSLLTFHVLAGVVGLLLLACLFLSDVFLVVACIPCPRLCGVHVVARSAPCGCKDTKKVRWRSRLQWKYVLLMPVGRPHPPHHAGTELGTGWFCKDIPQRHCSFSAHFGLSAISLPLINGCCTSDYVKRNVRLLNKRRTSRCKDNTCLAGKLPMYLQVYCLGA